MFVVLVGKGEGVKFSEGHSLFWNKYFLCSETQQNKHGSNVLVDNQRLKYTNVSLDSGRVIQLADKSVQLVLGPDKDVTHVLVLTHCENICLLNYANVAEVVSTFFFKEEAGHRS